MKRFTIMLQEETIAKIKKANYSPSKKRKLIETILDEMFNQVEQNNYPKTMKVNIKIEAYQYETK